MRCARALDKMRRYLTARGTAITTVKLAALLTTEAARPVSAQAVSVLTTRMLDALATGPSPNILLLSKGVSHTMKIIKIKYAALATVLLLSGVVIPLTHALPPKTGDLPDTPHTVRSLLDQAQAAADSDKTMTANFSYVVTDPTNGVRKDIGIVKLMKPNYAAISFSNGLGLPTTTEIHSDGQTVWNYHAPTNHYTTQPADPQGANINVWRLITIGSFFSVDTWIRGGIYADPSELHYIGRQMVDGTEYQVLEHKMVGTMYGKDVPFDQKVFFGPDHLIHRFTMDFTIDGKPGTEYADLTNIQLSQPMQSSEFAYTPPVGAILVPKQD